MRNNLLFLIVVITISGCATVEKQVVYDCVTMVTSNPKDEAPFEGLDTWMNDRLQKCMDSDPELDNEGATNEELQGKPKRAFAKGQGKRSNRSSRAPAGTPR